MRVALLVGGWMIISPLTLFLSLTYFARISNTKAFGSLVRYSARTYASESPYYLFSSMPGEVKGFQTALNHRDARPVLAQKLLEQYNSPLADQSDFIVAKSDELGVDYRWPVAIAIAESGGCRYIPHESNNCWGYGVYGTQTVKFADLREGITKVIELIAAYQTKGAVTPEEIMRWYTPPSVEKGGPWAKTVRYLFQQME